MSPTSEPRHAHAVEAAYAHCVALARAHYENFPVASRLLPAHLRPHVAAIYAFARHADDLADEGTMIPEERLTALRQWRESLDEALVGDAAPTNPIVLALVDTLRHFSIPVTHVHALIDAFEQDARRPTFAGFDDVLDYCRRSANPVGRILLHLFGLYDEARARHADALCTGLQLANFWQDLSTDIPRSRVYIPSVDLQRFGVRIPDLLDTPAPQHVRDLMRFQVDRTRRFFDDALPLFHGLPFRLHLELKATRLGGIRILDRITSMAYDVTTRPALSRLDTLGILLRSVLCPSPRGVRP